MRRDARYLPVLLTIFASAPLACGDSDATTGTADGTDGTTTSETEATTTAPTTTTTSDATTTAGSEDVTSDTGTTAGTTDETATDTDTDTDADPICGDGNVDAGEECDDGNGDNTDACLDTCVAASCGDGYVQAGAEACDDGNDDNSDACLDTCAEASCGDGFVGPGEGCDDGNTDDNDACNNSCAPILCGDGLVQEPEQCDDGNDDNTDACLDTCAAASCGDSYVEDGVEACDDGNADNTDACTELCAAPACDDGLVSGDESDLDCGGSCDPCALGLACAGDDDCAEGLCVGELCTLIANCADLLAAEPNTPTGEYEIDPDGEGGADPLQVSCDMDTDGGGWTLVFHVYAMGGHPNGLREQDFIGLFNHNTFTNESWTYDDIANQIIAGNQSLTLLGSQGALDIDQFAGAWDDVRMTCSLNNNDANWENFAQVNGYATQNGSDKLHGAAANGTSYMVDASSNSFDQATIWHDNEPNTSNSGHYLCDYTNSGGASGQFGFCYTDHLNNPNNLDYGDSIVSVAFGTTYGADGWSVGFTAECGDMGTTAQQNTGTYAIWIR